MILPLSLDPKAQPSGDGWAVWTAELLIPIRAIWLHCWRRVHGVNVGPIPLMLVDHDGVDLDGTPIRLGCRGALAGMIIRVDADGGSPGGRPFVVVEAERYRPPRMGRPRRASRVVVIR